MADRSQRRRGHGRVAFLAHREEIRVALQEGWPRAAVHGRMRQVLGMSYQQFVRYVDRYLADAPHGTVPHGPVPYSTAPGRGSSFRPAPEGAPSAPVRAPAALTAFSPVRPPADAPVEPPTAGELPRFTFNPGRQTRDKLV